MHIFETAIFPLDNFSQIFPLPSVCVNEGEGVCVRGREGVHVCGFGTYNNLRTCYEAK